MLANHLFCNQFGTHWFSTVSLMFCDNLPHCFCYLPTCTVAKSHNHCHCRVLCCMLLRLTQLLLHFFWQTCHITNNTETHIILHEDFVFQRRKHKAHQRSNLICRTIPVLCWESIEREKLHTQSYAFWCYAANGIYSCLMSIGAWLIAFGCPTSITIHCDGNMLGDSCHI